MRLSAKITIVGSTRAIVDDDSSTTVNSSRNSCLVLPEGLDSECRLLFKFSLLCAQACPDIPFIWRLHPGVTFKSLFSKNGEFGRLPANITLSKNSLAQDIELSRWSLYRGTTAIVQAISAGVRPVYFDIPGEINIDPLEDLNDWRITVSEADDFKRFVEVDRDQPFPDVPGVQLAKEFCKNLFTPLTARAFEDAIVETHV